jgi:hypothetical protein
MEIQKVCPSVGTYKHATVDRRRITLKESHPEAKQPETKLQGNNL